MNGGGGGGGESGPGRHGMISLEDLESFTEDQLSDSGTGSLEDGGDTMEEEDQPDRLLHYWQDVARGHQVEVPQGRKTTGRGDTSPLTYMCAMCVFTLLPQSLLRPRLQLWHLKVRVSLKCTSGTTADVFGLSRYCNYSVI